MIRRHPIPRPVPESPPPLPAYGGMPCIWMSAGLVAYKLCDRGFECDGCPFDRAMRGALPPVRVGRGPNAGPTIEGGSGTGRAASRDHGASILLRVVS